MTARELKKMTKNKQAFTLIELIVVIAVLGLLVLLAAPRFIGKTDDALETQIKHDVKASESKVAELLVTEDEDYLSWDSTTASELQTLIDGNSLYGKRGLVKNVPEGEYKIIPDTYVDKEINSKLDGAFYANSGGDVFYHGEPGIGQSDTDEVTDVLPELDVPDYYVVATDEDFVKVDNDYSWTSFEGDYFYRYVGEADYVVVPNVIHGETITSTYRMFESYYTEETGYVDLTVMGVAMNNPNVTDMSYMFQNIFGDTDDLELELDYLDTSRVKNMDGMFNGVQLLMDVSHLETSSATSMYRMLSQTAATTYDLSGWDTSNVKDMSLLFYGSDVQIINVDGWDTSQVESMRAMFKSLDNVEELNLAHFDTSSVTDMSEMFSNTKKLSSLDLSQFDTSNVTTMNGMFLLTSVDSLDLSNFDTRNVTDMSYMFNMVYKKEMDTLPVIDISSFVISNETDTSLMFSSVTPKKTVYVRSNSEQEILSDFASYVNIVVSP